MHRSSGTSLVTANTSAKSLSSLVSCLTRHVRYEGHQALPDGRLEAVSNICWQLLSHLMGAVSATKSLLHVSTIVEKMQGFWVTLLAQLGTSSVTAFSALCPYWGDVGIPHNTHGLWKVRLLTSPVCEKDNSLESGMTSHYQPMMLSPDIRAESHCSFSWEPVQRLVRCVRTIL